MFADLPRLILEHLRIAVGSVGAAIALAIPLVLLARRYRWLTGWVLGLTSATYAIPSLALMILLVPLFGLGWISVAAAIALYCQSILLRHGLAAIESIPPTSLETALAMGMTPAQTWLRVWWPLMLPVVIAGIRLATLTAVAIAAIGAKFGSGGLGVLLFDGISQTRFDKLIVGAVAITLLAWGLNALLLWLERQTDYPRSHPLGS